ncbi:hypothetical protein N431DRAFT_456141 [Stipitochalara longipes BDJ]|nr:hypothetical protein N431DRAFT_456141 [Stipitochalara longipes BDJ]
MHFQKYVLALCAAFPLLTLGHPTPNLASAPQQRDEPAKKETWPYYGYPGGKKRAVSNTGAAQDTWPYYGYPAQKASAAAANEKRDPQNPEGTGVPTYGYRATTH